MAIDDCLYQRNLVINPKQIAASNPIDLIDGDRPVKSLQGRHFGASSVNGN